MDRKPTDTDGGCRAESLTVPRPILAPVHKRCSVCGCQIRWLDREPPKDRRYTQTPLAFIGGVVLPGCKKSFLNLDAGSDLEAEGDRDDI
jgi:hypothetical protein